MTESELYIQRARQALNTAQNNLQEGDYAASVNRSYYAMFYAANALLATKGVSRSKHSGVISAFREEFVKPGLIEPEHSDAYGSTLDARHLADYAVGVSTSSITAQQALEKAHDFVKRVERQLQEMGEMEA